MPTTRGTRQKNATATTYASVCLSAGRGVESARNREARNLPTLKTCQTVLARKEYDSEIVASAEKEVPMEHDNTDSSSDTPVEQEDITDPPAPEEVTHIDTQLLALRQKFKKICSNLSKMKSHLDFIEKCKEKSTVPKGLRVKVQCNALLADFTNVGHQFQEIKQQAESDFAEALIQHYHITTSKLESEKQDLIISMDRLCKDCSDPQMVSKHQELLKKTEDNVNRFQKTLEDRKKKKLETLDQPRAKKPRQSNPRSQRRGMNNPVSPPLSLVEPQVEETETEL